MTEDERKILEFGAQHRAILLGHVQALLNVSASDADRRLADLARRGLTRHHRTHHRQAGHHQITSRGLAAIHSPLPEPRFETIREHRHDMSLPWLTLLAQRGGLGTVERVVTERAMRHHDAIQRLREQHRPQPDSEPDDEPIYGVALGTGRDKTVVRHYPDLMLTTPQGRVAIELQARQPAPHQLATQIVAYGADPHIVTALYLVDNPQIGETVQTTAARLGLSNPTHVQTFEFGKDTPVTTAQ